MKLIIDIDEEIYKSSKKECDENDSLIIDTFTYAIGNGTSLVQCKECDYWEKSENSLQGRCCLLQIYPTGEWFCGNAKKKENEE